MGGSTCGGLGVWGGEAQGGGACFAGAGRRSFDFRKFGASLMGVHVRDAESQG